MKAMKKLFTAACGVVLLVGSTTGETVTRGVLQLNATLDKNTKSSANWLLITASTSYTVAQWMKIDDSKCASRTDDLIWRHAGSYGGETSLVYDKTNNKLRMVRYKGYGSPADNQKIEVDAPTDGGWHFVAAVFDKTNAKMQIYIDDVCTEKSGVATGTEPAPKSPFEIGTFDNNTDHRNFCGCMAEMSVWTAALSAEQLQTLHWKRPSGDGFANCVAYWPMDEGNHGTNVRDVSGGTEHPIALSSKIWKSTTPVHDLTEVNDFPAEFDAGDTRVFLAVNTQYRSDVSDIVVSDATQDDNGKFLKDAPATFTAVAKGSGVTFVRWFGDVPEESVSNATITIVVDKEKTIVPYFTGIDWLYDPSTKTICDGAWTIGATVSEDRMALSGRKNALSIPYVDLAKRVADVEGNDYMIVSLGTDVFSENSVIEEVVLPETLETTAGWFDANDNMSATFLRCTKLRKVTPFLPAAITAIGELTFSGCASLAGDLTLGGGDAELVLRQFTYVGSGKSKTRGDQFVSTKITSVTVEKTVHRLPLSVFSGCSALTNVVFAKGSITNIAQSAFSGCTKVTEFVMPERPELIEATAFNGWTSNQCRFVVHAADPGWAAYMADGANFLPWDSLDANTRAGYKAKFVGAKRPLGLSIANPKNQWLCSDSNGGMKILFR